MSDIQHYFAGKTVAKTERFDRFQRGVKHTHDYDHLSIVLQGRFALSTDNEHGDYGIYGPGSVVVIEAGKQHQIVALEDDSVWACIHSDNEQE